MFADIQAKITVLLAGVVVLLASNVGSYFYGHSVGVESQLGKQAKVEVVREAKVADTAITHTGAVVAGVTQDNDKEQKADERYETALAQLRASRADNRRLLAERGGLRIPATVCAGREGAAGETQTAGAGQGTGAIAGTVALPELVDEDLQRRADEADAILEKLRVLRDWTIDQGFARPEAVPDGPGVEVNY